MPKTNSKKKRRMRKLKEVIENKDRDWCTPQEGFILDPLVFNNETFNHRTFGVNVSVDLELIKECGYDLDPWLKRYEPWISITMPYCAKVVKNFYANMIVTKEADQTILYTNVRGKQIKIDAVILNDYFGFPKDIEELRDFSEEEMLKIYALDRPMEDFKFPPKQHFNNHFRLLHLVYTRIMACKGKNVTHLTDIDNPILPALIGKFTFNVGKQLVNEMKKYVASRSTTPLPFPQLISYILWKNNIWYLDDGDDSIEAAVLSESNLRRMGIPIRNDNLEAIQIERSKNQDNEAQLVAKYGDRSRTTVPPPTFSGSVMIEEIAKRFEGTVKLSEERYEESVKLAEERYEESVKRAEERLSRKFSEEIKRLERIIEVTREEKEPTTSRRLRIFINDEFED